MKPHVLHLLSSETAFGLYELLRTNAANIHKSDDWFTLFSLLEVVGAGAHPPSTSNPKHLHQSHSIINAESDSECSDCLNTSPSDKGYTSDSEVYRRSDYIVVNHNDLETNRHQYSHHDRRALTKSCEILSFLIRDLAYVTQENFEYCIHCIRIFIEAIIKEQIEKSKSKLTNHRNSKQIRRVTSLSSLNNENLSDVNTNQMKQTSSDYDEDSIKQEYQTLTLQLLDLMHTLHMNASQIYKQIPTGQTISSTLWYKCWCPILQGERILRFPSFTD